jgi:hypothetical protein
MGAIGSIDVVQSVSGCPRRAAVRGNRGGSNNGWPPADARLTLRPRAGRVLFNCLGYGMHGRKKPLELGLRFRFTRSESGCCGSVDRVSESSNDDC